MSAADQTLQLTLRVAPPKQAPVQFTVARAAALVVSDVTMFVVSSILAFSIIHHHVSFGFLQGTPLYSVLAYMLIWLVTFERVGLYRRSFAFSTRDEFYYTVTALFLGILPQLVLFTIVPSLSTSRLELVLATAIAVVLVGGSRAVIHATRNVMARHTPDRIAIVGKGERIAAVAQAIGHVEGREVLRLDVGDIDATVDGVSPTADSALDEIPWFRTARQWGCDTLMLTEMLPPNIMPMFLEIAAQQRIRVAFAPPRVQCHSYSLSMSTDGQQALIIPSQLRACTPFARLLKRVMDFAIALFALLITSPIMAAAAFAVWLESPGPILYRQVRVGRNGKTFQIMKFRSMKVDAESSTGPVWATVGDDRTTRVGHFIRRTSIDELPQIFNVLRGDMSIVGPRPERPVFVKEFRRLLPRYDERHLVRPGITSLSHVNMRRVVDPSAAGERLSYDLFYVEHWSIFLDLSIVFKTALEVLFQRAA